MIGQEAPSRERHQRAGISQGCPLSPFLFVMLMTVLIQDVAAELGEEDRARLKRRDLDVVLYADDTLLIGSSEDGLQRLLETVEAIGARYGLQLHHDKFQFLQVRRDLKHSQSIWPGCSQTLASSTGRCLCCRNL